jgi:hypothetical protein
LGPNAPFQDYGQGPTGLRVQKVWSECVASSRAIGACAGPGQARLFSRTGLSRSDHQTGRNEYAPRGSSAIVAAHPLLRSAAYALAEPVGRREWHEKLAEAVSDPEERARHLALSATGPEVGVADALEDGARLANARGAPAAAGSLAEQAAALTPVDQQDAIQRRQIASARYRLRAGDTMAAREVLEAVLRRSLG